MTLQQVNESPEEEEFEDEPTELEHTPDGHSLENIHHHHQESSRSWGRWCRSLLGDGNSNLLLQVIFFLLGIGILVPWNAFISAKAYFETRFCDQDGHYFHASAKRNLESTFAIVYNCSSCFSLGLLLLGQWFSDQRQAAQEAAALRNPQALSPTSSPQALRDTSPNPTKGGMDPATDSGIAQYGGGCGRSTSSHDSTASASGHSFWLVMVPLSIYFAVFFSQAVAVLWVDLEPKLFYTFTVASLALCGACGALASSGIVATAGLFLPSIGMEPFLAGQSAGGLGVSLANLIAATYEDPHDFWDSQCSPNNSNDDAMPSSLGWSSMDASGDESCAPYSRRDHAVLVYFWLGSIVLAACLVGYAYINNFQSTNHRDDYETVQDHETTTNASMTESSAQSPRGLEMNNVLIQQRQQQQPHFNEELRHRDEERAISTPSSLDHLDLQVQPQPRNRPSPHRGVVNTAMSFGHDDVLDSHHKTENEMTEVWSIVKSPAISVLLVFFVTLSLFPGWISQLQSVQRCSNVHERWANDLYTPIAFVLFNSGDLAGRIIAGYAPLSKWHHVSTKLLVSAALRFSFFPLMYLCISHHNGNKWAIHSDLYSWGVQALFGISNGLVVTLAFVHAPSLLPNVTHVQERSAELLNFCLYLGLLSGSLFSVPASSMLAG